MTRHKHAHIGLGTPSPLDHWINATLRMLAMLVLHVASTFRMKARRSSVNATPTTPLDLPQRTTDTHQETTAVAQDSPTTPSVSLGSRQAIHLPHTACGGGNRAPMSATKGNLPPPVRSTGGGGLRALARKTEGAQAKPTVTSGSVNSVHAFPAKAGTQPSSEKSAQRAHHLNP